jgi:hypothetical protein
MSSVVPQGSQPSTIKTNQFLLYYTAILQFILGITAFSHKMEWVSLVCIFFVMIIHGFGLAVNITPKPDTTGNLFVDAFGKLEPIPTLKTYIGPYANYLIMIPLLLNAISVKLISNYEGNQRLSKERKQFKTRMYAVKVCLILNLILFCLITLFGFPILGFTANTTVPLVALGISMFISIIQIILSALIYDSY